MEAPVEQPTAFVNARQALWERVVLKSVPKDFMATTACIHANVQHLITSVILSVAVFANMVNNVKLNY
jgi:hypothetical protein